MNRRRWRLQINDMKDEPPALCSLPLTKKQVDVLIDFLIPYMNDRWLLGDAEVFSPEDWAEYKQRRSKQSQATVPSS